MAISNVTNDTSLPLNKPSGNNVPFTAAETSASQKPVGDSSSTVAQSGQRVNQAEQTEETIVNIEQQVSDLSDNAQRIERRLQFKVDEDSGSTVVSVFDRQTDELIRQIPPDELLTLTKRLKQINEGLTEETSGLLLQRQV